VTAFVSAAVYGAAGYRGNHPLAIPRIAPVEALCAILWGVRPEESPIADRTTLERFHAPAYLDALQAAEARGRASEEERRRFNLGTMENPVFAGLWQRAATSVGGSIRAAELAHAQGLAFHPAGGTHHGLADRAHGFCYFNDPVFAILRLLDLGHARVAHVDLDAHHGDGVEAAFRDDPRVLTVSIHQAGRWPFTGGLSLERPVNLPVPPGLNDSEFALLIEGVVLPRLHRFAPDALVVTMGADALAGDPLSGLMLSNLALWDAVTALVRLGPSVVLGGGGYNPWTLARAWAGAWGRLAGREIPARLPPAAQAVLAALDCDLVEPEDRDPAWTNTLADRPNPGPVRPEVAALLSPVEA
jgi:acetoin utilization protein AcuC